MRERETEKAAQMLPLACRFRLVCLNQFFHVSRATKGPLCSGRGQLLHWTSPNRSSRNMGRFGGDGRALPEARQPNDEIQLASGGCYFGASFLVSLVKLALCLSASVRAAERKVEHSISGAPPARAPNYGPATNRH